MTSLFSYLITMLVAMFWIFRVVVAYTSSMSIDFGGIVPLDINIEIVVLFTTLFSMIFIIKRNIIGGIIYLASYGLYFGVDLYNEVTSIMGGEAVTSNYLSLFISFVAILLAILTFLDILLNKNRKGRIKDKKTDWFYTNNKYEREYDERADKNQYKNFR